MKILAHRNSTQGKIEKWLSSQKVGTRFVAVNIGKPLNLTAGDIGMFIKWHDRNFKKVGVAPNGSSTIWEIVSTEVPLCQ